MKGTTKLWKAKRDYDVYKITMICRKRLWCVQKDYDEYKKTMMSTKRLWCAQKDYDVHKQIMMCTKRLWCVQKTMMCTKRLCLYTKGSVHKILRWEQWAQRKMSTKTTRCKIGEKRGSKEWEKTERHHGRGSKGSSSHNENRKCMNTTWVDWMKLWSFSSADSTLMISE